MKQDRSLQRHYLCHHRYICVLAAAAVVLLIACVISTYNLWIDTAAEDDATLITEPPNIVLLETLGVFEQISGENERSKLGNLLLEDNDGNKMKTITEQSRMNVHTTNREICIQWLWGKGKKPVTWRTFINVLKEAGLITLADDIFNQINPKFYNIEKSQIHYQSEISPTAHPLIRAAPDLVILETIGVFDKIQEYRKFGTLLLNDKDGVRIENIIANNNYNVHDINRQICILWLRKIGQQPVTWRIFINAVNATGLKLAGDIFKLIDPNFIDAATNDSVDLQRIALIQEPPNLVILERLNIVDMVHDCYKFGILLLEDDFGIKMKMIIRKFGSDAHNIYREMMIQWLWGRGRQPVNWQTFIYTVNSSGLKFADNLLNIIDPKYLDTVATNMHFGGALIQEPPSLVVFEQLDIFNLIHDYSGVGLRLLEDKFGVSMKDITQRNNDMQNINKDICRQWLSGKGKQPVSWRTFIDILNKTQIQLANDILKIIDDTYLDINSSLYTHPSIMKAISILKTDYNRQLLFDFNVIDLHYLNISLRYSSGHDNVIDKDVWEVLHEINYSETVLITGQPGAGKTSLMRYLAKLWANGVIFKACQILFLIPLKDGENILSLDSLLRKYPDRLQDTISIAEEIEFNRGAGTCFLLDSYEWNHDYVYQLLQGNKLYNSLRIVTARRKEIFLQISERQHFEIVGFKNNNLPHYLDKISNNQTLNRMVLTLWKNQPNVKELSTLPLLFSMILSVVKDESNESPLETRTQVYMLFVLKAIFQSNSKTDRPYHFLKDCIFQDVSSNEMCAAFQVLLKVSFQMTFNGQRSFLDDESDEILLKLQNTGFVTTELTGHMNRRKFIFSHLTFCEFFAALHLAVLPLEKQYHYATSYHQSWFSVFQFFFGIQKALQLTITDNISSVLQRIAMHYSKKSWLLSKHCHFQYRIELHEFLSELEEVHKSTVIQKSGIIVNSTLCVYSDVYRQHDAMNTSLKNVTVYWIQYNETSTIRSLIIDHYSADYRNLWSCILSEFDGSDICAEFPGIVSLQLTIRNARDSVRLRHMLEAFTNLQSLHLDLSPIHSDYDLIAKVLPNIKCMDELILSGLLHVLNYLKIPCVNRLVLVGDKHYHNLPEMVNYSPLLQFVFLYHPTWIERDMCTFMPIKDALEYPDQLQMLTIEGTSLDEQCKSFTFSGLIGLKHLHIKDVSVSGSSLELCLNEITRSSKLLTLELSNTLINDGQLATLLKSLPTILHHLILNDLMFSNYDLKVLSESLKRINLHSLTLKRNNLTSKDFHLLVDSLGDSTSLQTLDVAHNSMIFGKRMGLEALSQLTNLQYLNLTGCEVDEKHIPLFYQIVGKLSKLESLSLCEYSHDPEFREELIRGMVNLTKLKYFRGTNCYTL